MHPPALDPRPVAPAELTFTLRVRPESVEDAWQAELVTPDGERRTFETPLDLLRHLAALAPPPARGGGLR